MLAACFSPAREPDCLLDGTCECKTSAQCSIGKLCVNGRCYTPIDAGQPGSLGYPCTVDAECTVGPCLPKGPGNGQICTVLCNTPDAGTSCPKGWECKNEGSRALCTPPLKALCLPCKADSECNAAGDRCLPLDGGSFCGSDCTFAACPAGFSCQSLSVGGRLAQQCVSDKGTCECSAVTVGLQRSCSKKAPLGTCFGFETCQPNGNFSGCDARTASREVCNGVDDDCNGLPDQADPARDTSGVAGFPNCSKGLACKGLFFCGPEADAGASFQCSAPTPMAETCNGVDDDCDGERDEGLPACPAQLACGAYACARRRDGSVVCWGRNEHAQLGDVVCWGENDAGQLGDGTQATRALVPAPVVGLTDAVELAIGSNHSCARRSTGEVVCWGENYFGQLGDGTTTRRFTPEPVVGLDMAVEVAAGFAHSCARRATGEVLCWGDYLRTGPLALRTIVEGL